MDLFTLRFKTKIPWFALRLLLVAGVVILASLAYSCLWNPEVSVYKKAIEVKRAWSHKITQEYGAKTVIFGGSSCSFSINGERLLEQHRIPVANLGLHAGLRPTFITNFAISETRPGDTLIVALEPNLLTRPFDLPSLAVQLGYAIHLPSWVEGPWLESSVSKASAFFALRPSAYYIFVMLGKLSRGMPLYRYKPSDIHPSGWMTTDYRRSFNIGKDDGPRPQLSKEGENLLQWLRDWSAAHHVRIAYSLPWMYVAPEDIDYNLKRNTVYLEQVSQFIPVLKDPRLGICPREYFADTNYHLTVEAAAMRTDSLAQQLKSWDVWTSDELQTMISSGTVNQPNTYPAND